MNRDQLRQFCISGTVTFPATFPQLARLELRKIDRLPKAQGSGLQRGDTLLVATENPSPRVSLTRSVLISDVRAVFIPRDYSSVSYENGIWLLDSEVESGLEIELYNRRDVWGIAFVPEFSPSLLEVSAGMTAGESIQYYPPLPRDPAHNHYGGVQLPPTAPVRRSNPGQQEYPLPRREGVTLPCEPLSPAPCADVHMQGVRPCEYHNKPVAEVHEDCRALLRPCEPLRRSV
jgi:hypothetical protein